jgi:hypothetical protein
MGADEPDVDDPIWIVDPHDDPIFVPTDIEDGTAIFENTCASDVTLHIGRFRPIRPCLT